MPKYRMLVDVDFGEGERHLTGEEIDLPEEVGNKESARGLMEPVKKTATIQPPQPRADEKPKPPENVKL